MISYASGDGGGCDILIAVDKKATAPALMSFLSPLFINMPYSLSGIVYIIALTYRHTHFLLDIIICISLYAPFLSSSLSSPTLASSSHILQHQ